MSPNSPIMYVSGPRPCPGEAGPAPCAIVAATAVSAAAVPSTARMRSVNCPPLVVVAASLPVLPRAVGYEFGTSGCKRGDRLGCEPVPLLLIRHASAGSRSEWEGDDRDRGLDERGVDQARRLI